MQVSLMKTERRSIWGCKNMEEPVSEIQSLGKHKKEKQTTCMVRVSTEKGFSFHVSLFGMDSIGTGFQRIRRTKQPSKLNLL